MHLRTTVAGGAAGVLTCLSLLGFTPATAAPDEGAAPASGAGAGSGAARNGGVDRYLTDRSDPASPAGSTTGGIDTSQLVLGTLAGIGVVGAGAAAMIVVRRRSEHLPHPA